MRPEHAAAASDDGVSYEDGEVVHGTIWPSADFVRGKRKQLIGASIISPLLCEVDEVQINTNSAVESSTNEHARIKDCDDAEQIGRTLSDVDEYVGNDYPTYLD